MRLSNESSGPANVPVTQGRGQAVAEGMECSDLLCTSEHPLIRISEEGRLFEPLSVMIYIYACRWLLQTSEYSESESSHSDVDFTWHLF